MEPGFLNFSLTDIVQAISSIVSALAIYYTYKSLKEQQNANRWQVENDVMEKRPCFHISSYYIEGDPELVAFKVKNIGDLGHSLEVFDKKQLGGDPEYLSRLAIHNETLIHKDLEFDLTQRIDGYVHYSLIFYGAYNHRFRQDLELHKDIKTDNYFTSISLVQVDDISHLMDRIAHR